jgi:hypothetical protein
MTDTHDIAVLRALAEQYAAIAALPVQAERRRLWASHFSLKPTRPLILATFGMWNVWCRDVFSDARMQCRDPFYREFERWFRMAIFQHEVGDDSIQEPWVTLRASVKGTWGAMWGITSGLSAKTSDDGAAHYEPQLRTWDDMARLRVTPHEVDEDDTARRLARLHDAVGDLLPIDVNRTPSYHAFMADISTALCQLRGLEQVMEDMYDAPDELHRLLAFMRDGILANNQQAEDAGHYTLSSSANQAMAYADTLEPLAPNSGPRRRRDLWGFCAAQEFTLISPAFHDEFLLQYQLPIYDHYGLVHYGCCEDLTRKIDMLRQMKNLRSIAVTPVADVRACAEQIGGDYAISWRPNPTDMVCTNWDEDRVRRIIADGLDACRGQYLHIHLKDVETVQGDPTRLTRWVRLVREIADACPA